MDVEQSIMYGFDLFGTMIFAITGAVKGVRCKLDILGVVVFACTVGCGGGMLRDMLLGATPVAAFSDSAYIIICVFTGLAVFFLAPRFVGKWRTILFCDAVGLGVFTALGMAKGAMYGIGPIGQILCGAFSAVGGGVIRDVMSKSVPAVLTSDFYATASLIGGLVYLLLEKLGVPLFPAFLATSVVVIAIRVIAIEFNFHLPVADTALPVEDHVAFLGLLKDKKHEGGKKS